MNTKICTSCKSIKPFSAFSKAKRERDGLQSRCKECNSKQSAEYRVNNIDKEKSRHAEYAARNKEKLREYQKGWADKNRDKRLSQKRERYQGIKEEENYRARAYHAKNAEKIKLNKKKWRAENIEYRKKYELEYVENNRDKINAKNSRRRAQLMRAIPLWANFDKIRSVYSECARITKDTGIEHHVDHIVPLKSKIVCGLHCEDNLQILTGSENSIKHNKLLI